MSGKIGWLMSGKIGWLSVGVVFMMFVLFFLALTAHAANKTPKTPRIAESFQTFRAELPKVIGPSKRTLRLPPSSTRYEFHHDTWRTFGKAMIFKECAYDFKNDPGEASCQTVWAHI